MGRCNCLTCHLISSPVFLVALASAFDSQHMSNFVHVIEKTDKTPIFHFFNQHIHSTELHIHFALTILSVHPCYFTLLIIFLGELIYRSTDLNCTGYQEKLIQFFLSLLQFICHHPIPLLLPQTPSDHPLPTTHSLPSIGFLTSTPLNMTERFICDLLASFNIWQMPTCLVHFCTK